MRVIKASQVPCHGPVAEHQYGRMQRKRQRGQDTARKRCCSNQVNSYSLILCRALRRAASVSGDCLTFGFCAPAPVVGEMIQMFGSVFGQTPKHVFFTVFLRFCCCFSDEVLYCFCHLGSATAASIWRGSLLSGIMARKFECAGNRESGCHAQRIHSSYP